MQAFNILVVDDEEDVAHALRKQLRRPDRHVITCTDPLEVPEIMANEKIDLIISDEHMPGMNGVNLLAQLRVSHPGTARILLTGNGSIDVAMRAINEGGVYKYLTKPWSYKELDAVVAGALPHVEELRKQARVSAASDRRRAMLEELEREYPGLLAVGQGPHVVVATPLAELLSRGVTDVIHDHVESDHARRWVEPVAAGAEPIALADALAVMLMRHPEVSLAIEPRLKAHCVSIEVDSHARTLLNLPRALGDTVVARLAVIAGLDIGGMGEQQGRLQLSLAGEEREYLAAFRTSSLGLAIELRRMSKAGATTGPVPVRSADDSHIGGYRTLGVLGEGGLGVVYRAVHEALERPVAIKLLHAGGARDALATARFLREARAASRARHKGIVEVLDFGQTSDGRSFLVMELVESPTLNQRLERGALPLEQAVAIARSIALALGAAHDAGVVHRDLKPSNVFVDDDMAAKLSDFGAAKIVGAAGPDLTQDGLIFGTPHYMSPEHARGLPVDRRTDLYALGCVLFEMVSGRPPFDGETSVDVMMKQVNTPAPPLTSPLGPVPHALARVARRAMAKNPGERHQTAAELIADLDQATASLGRTGWRRWLP